MDFRTFNKCDLYPLIASVISRWLDAQVTPYTPISSFEVSTTALGEKQSISAFLSSFPKLTSQFYSVRSSVSHSMFSHIGCFNIIYVLLLYLQI